MTHPATTDAVGQNAPAAEPSHAGDAPDGPLSVLVIISQYPPHHRGGYELRCRDVCRELARRGHRVTVLTSRAGARGTEQDEGVRIVRELHLWPDGVPNGARSVAQFMVASGADCRRLRRSPLSPPRRRAHAAASHRACIAQLGLRAVPGALGRVNTGYLASARRREPRIGVGSRGLATVRAFAEGDVMATRGTPA